MTPGSQVSRRQQEFAMQGQSPQHGKPMQHASRAVRDDVQPAHAFSSAAKAAAESFATPEKQQRSAVLEEMFYVSPPSAVKDFMRPLESRCPASGNQSLLSLNNLLGMLMGFSMMFDGRLWMVNLALVFLMYHRRMAYKRWL